jgi:hypothetical protein
MMEQGRGRLQQRTDSQVQYARTDIRKYSFTVRVVKPWNQLPDSVKQAADKEAFKKDMKNLKLATAQSGEKKQ